MEITVQRIAHNKQLRWLGLTSLCLGCGADAGATASSSQAATGSPASGTSAGSTTGAGLTSAGPITGSTTGTGTTAAGVTGTTGVVVGVTGTTTAGVTVTGTTDASVSVGGATGTGTTSGITTTSDTSTTAATTTAGTTTAGTSTTSTTGGVACDGGLTSCSGVCVDTTSSVAHCGACNSPCVGGRTCVSGACQCPSNDCPDLPAFPGADGAAANVSGGRGGDVYHVTVRDAHYSDLTPGTLRYGLSGLTGPRTIVFDVSGVFSLGRTPVAGWDSNGNGWDTASRLDIPANVTIAGQTAPGPVIIMGGVTKPGATNIILRNIVFAPGYGTRNFADPDGGPVAGDFPDSYVFDALDISGQQVMIDHVTTVYSTDETVSMNEFANDVTVQFSNISQGQNYPQADAESSGVSYTGHALGSLLQAGSNARVSFLYNLYAHQKGRLPRVGTEAGVLSVAGVGAFNDFRNNVFYNWLGTAGTGASGQPSQNNFIGNFYLAGPGGQDPAGGSSTAIVTAAGGTGIFDGNDSTNTKVYHSGNAKDTNKDSDAGDVTQLGNGDFSESSLSGSAFSETPYYGVTSTADAAFGYVLDYVGAAWWNRSIIDARLVSETRAGSGRIMAWADDPFDASASEGTEWRALVATPSASRAAGFDSDADGMPDTWESEHALDPNLADNNGDFDADGYTNLEEYLNELAAWPAPAQALFVGEGGSRYAELRNWSIGPAPTHTGVRRTAQWQPTRFDVAQIAARSAVVDAAGQHAGVLEVAGQGASGGQASLSITSGVLRVHSELRVGSYLAFSAEGDALRRSGRGQVEQTGGLVSAGRRVIIEGAPGARASSYRLEAGRLVTPWLSAASSTGFEFLGGTLEVGRVDFDLVIRGGRLEPLRGTELLVVAGDLRLGSGALELELGPRRQQRLHVRGTATLDGALELVFAEGYELGPGTSLSILEADAGIVGRFRALPAGYRVDVVGNRLLLSRADALMSQAVEAGLCGEG